jgi:hypothetical protein
MSFFNAHRAWRRFVDHRSARACSLHRVIEQIIAGRSGKAQFDWCFLVVLAATTGADAKECLKGAAVGGVAGHYSRTMGYWERRLVALSDVTKPTSATACKKTTSIKPTTICELERNASSGCATARPRMVECRPWHLVSSDLLMQTEERKNRHNDDNQADQINNTVHKSLP